MRPRFPPLLAAALLAGCAGTMHYEAPEHAAMSARQAREIVQKFGERWGNVVGPDEKFWRNQSWKATSSGIELRAAPIGNFGKVLPDSRLVTCPYSAMRPAIKKLHPVYWTYLGPGCPWGHHYSFKEEAAAKEFLHALVALKSAPPPSDEADSPAFAGVLRAYKDRSKRPALSEEARKHMVRAEAAVAQKRFEDAAAEYRRQLELAPWWAQAYYNLALIYHELGHDESAVTEMRKYLALEPDAEDARQAKDMIYAWGGE